MATNFLQKTLGILLKRQTNILSAAAVIMTTVIFSQILGLMRQRLLVGIFGASNTLGVYLASTRFPDFLFQVVIAGALSSAFIPVFSDYLSSGKEKEAHKMASTLLVLGFMAFSLFSLLLMIFAPFFLQLLNLGSGFSGVDMSLMVNLTRIYVVGQLLFIVGIFFLALLQSYNHFFTPGLALGLYNLGMIIGIVAFSRTIGIYSAAYGVIIGALLFILAQLPLVKQIGFSFRPVLSWKIPGVTDVLHLMWPRTISNAVFQLGAIITVTLISYIPMSGRNYVIFDYAQTLAFAPIALFGQTIAQAAFPILSRERNKLPEFRATFITSFNQMLYLVLPISVLILVLRIPIVRLIYGVGKFDWPATVLTGRVLAFFAVSIFAQALIMLVSRAFYALYDTKIPLIVGGVTTISMVLLAAFFIFYSQFGIESVAIAYSIASILNLLILMIFLDRKVQGFDKMPLFSSISKIFLASFCTGFALYIPLKLLDQLVVDTTHTLGLLLITGISGLFGLSLYLFLTWLFAVKEAEVFILLFKRAGNWREILSSSNETLEDTNLRP